MLFCGEIPVENVIAGIASVMVDIAPGISELGTGVPGLRGAALYGEGVGGGGAPCCIPERCIRLVSLPGTDRHSSLETHVLVEMGGIEPPSDGRTTGLLRVQLASVFLGPGVSREQGRRRAQSMKSPESPTDTSSQQWLPR